jgi:hypothetical protein
MIIGSLNGFVQSKGSKTGRLRRSIENYKRDESGALLVFGLMLVITMLIIGGFAVNMMRYERVRVDLSQTLDRAALAAASLSQTLDPEEVVKDYMKKSDMLPLLKEVKVTATANGRIVEARARVDVPFFMAKMIGVDDLPAYAGSKARQDITDLEIMMVLDISGSMGETDGNGSTKIAALRKAAKEFVAQMITADSIDHISIGIVPYNAQVNLGPKLIARYNVDASAAVPNGSAAPHGRTDIHCIDLPDSAFAQRGISRINPMFRMARSDTLSGINSAGMDENVTADKTNDQFYCGPYNVSEISSGKLPSEGYVMMPTNDKTKLNTHIDNLWASGNTSIVLGMKWGVALIDPSAEDIYDYFVSQGDIPSVFSDRPYPYSKEDSLKVIVLMTDGTHVEHSRILSPFNAGWSPIYKNNSGNYALRVDWAFINNNTDLRNRTGGAAWSPSNQAWYFVPHLQTSWDNSPTTIRSQAWRSSITGYTQLTWAEVWAELTPQWVAWHMYARAYGGNSSSARNNVYNDYRWTRMVGNWKSVSQMDSLLQSTCTLAKTATGASDNPVVVFGIAFNAPGLGETQIKNCASKPTEPYFFKVEPGGMTISEAFSTIGSTINNLRLTQ